MNIRLFRDKYDIKTPKNHRRLNIGNFLTNISHFGESNMVYLSNNGPLVPKIDAKCPKIRSQGP